jgi:hypothetical protein
MSDEHPETKTCTACGLDLPVESFNFEFRRGTYRPSCKACVKKYIDSTFEHRKKRDKEYRAKRLDHYDVIQKEYYAKNRGEILRKKAVHYRENIEIKKEYNRRSWIATKNNPLLMEKNKIKMAKWKSENRDKVNEKRRSTPDYWRKYVGKRRALKSGADGFFSSSDIKSLLSSQKEKCAICKKSIKNAKYEVDHIMPLALGGSNWPTNLQILCPSCNRSKGAKHPIDYMQSLGYLL